LFLLLITNLNKSCPEIKKVWYADDGTGAERIEHLKPFWDSLCEQGPSCDYFPKAAKSVLIVKDPDLLEKANKVFVGVDIEITCEGQRHLGAAIGTNKFKIQYVNSKVEKWEKDVEKLSLFAEDEPQAALTALQHLSREFHADGTKKTVI
jgi:hypothetical protein